MTITKFLPYLAIALFISSVIGRISVVYAIDHKNLDEGRPLRIEDAYAIGHREIAIESGIRYFTTVDERSNFALSVEALYGLMLNTHISIGSSFLIDRGEDARIEASDNLKIGILHNLNQETLYVPAFGFKLESELPTGDSDQVIYEIKLLGTKSIQRLSFHVNVAYDYAILSDELHRQGAAKLVVGASYPIGAPFHTRTLLIVDYYLEESHLRGEDNIQGAEIGLRYQIRERAVLDAGLGSEFSGPEHRSQLLSTIGLSYSF